MKFAILTASLLLSLNVFAAKPQYNDCKIGDQIGCVDIKGPKKLLSSLKENDDGGQAVAEAPPQAEEGPQTPATSNEEEQLQAQMQFMFMTFACSQVPECIKQLAAKGIAPAVQAAFPEEVVQKICSGTMNTKPLSPESQALTDEVCKALNLARDI